jgi:hypothetical protein
MEEPLVSTDQSGPDQDGLHAVAHGLGYYDAVCEFEYLTAGEVVYGRRTPAELLEELGVPGGSLGPAFESSLARQYVEGYQSYADELLQNLRAQLLAMRDSLTPETLSAKLLADITSNEDYIIKQEARFESLPLQPGGILAAWGRT